MHVAGLTADDQVFGEAAARIDLRVGLRHRMAAFFHRGEIDHLIGDAAVLDLAIRRLDEAVFVHPRISGERIDQSDIRTFRRFDRTDTAIVRRVHVAHLEARALAGQAAGAKRRQTPLVGDFRQRVGLVHELRELRGTEELAHRGCRRLRIDQVLRHDGVDIDRRHALLDRAFHAQQADAILIFHQFADRAHAPIAEMIDVVDLALAVAQIDQRANDRDDVVLAQHAHGVGRIEVETHVHFHAADSRKVVTLGIEEERAEHRLGGFHRRRLARTHDPVNVEQRILARHVLVDRERIADVSADIHMIDVEQRQFLVAGLDQNLEVLLGDFLAGLHVDFAGAAVGQIFRNVMADQFLVGHAKVLEALLRELTRLAHGQFLAGFDNHAAGIGVDEIVDGLVALQAVGIERHAPAFLGALVAHMLVEGAEDLLAVEAERIEQRRHRNLAAAVDTRIDDVLGVELDVEP